MRITMKKYIIMILGMILLLAPMTAEAQKPLKRKEKTEQNGGKPNGGKQTGEKPTKTGNGRQGRTSTTPTQPIATSGTLSLGYGTWEGGIMNGKPHGNGKITFTATHAVDRSSTLQANPGDYFEANYDRGSLISGKLYDSAGTLLKTIIP